jgi:DNA-binding MarR family transcriptional regulator
MADAGANRGVSSPLDGLLGYQLRRASSAVMADFAQGLARIDLKPSEASVLLLIEDNPRATQSEIGRVLGIKRANMAPLVAALEKRELVERAPVDGRSQGLTLTAHGGQIALEARAVVHSNEAKFFGRLSTSQREQLFALLGLLRGGFPLDR